MSSAISASVQALRAIWRRRPNTQAVAEAVAAEAVVARHRRVCESARAWGETEDISTDSPSLLSHRRKKKSRFLLLLLPHRQSARITPVPLLLTGVRHHPPGRTDKNLCRCFGAPVRRVSYHLITDRFKGSATTSPPLTTESPTTHYCTVQHHVPIDPYAERMPRADCSSNTIRDSISRVSPSLRGPRFAPALRHARRPCALTRGRPAVPRQPGTGRSRRTARRAALAPAVLR